jgi:hypothetical protein
MNSWVELGFYHCRVIFILKLKSEGLMGLPVGIYLGLAMVVMEPILQATSIDFYPTYRPSTIPTNPFKP